MSRSSDQDDRVFRLFVEASRHPSSEQFGFLDRACPEDSAIRAEVASLLVNSEHYPDFLKTGKLGLGAEVRLSDEPLPDRIGRYKVEALVGEGGMGVVYRARQEHPVGRTVAVKVLRRGGESRRVSDRFEMECRALALMDHPNIARVHTAGVTREGRPYFAMEYVAGEPITEYCDRKCLSLQSRLELFVRVCAGIQHAHQKAIIHRDLKPSNVLVVEIAGRAEPKVIDFGIAKITEAGLMDKSLHTVAGELLCTPEYMSPEQAEMRSDCIDTRTDVYGLGLLLYEVLCGARPFDARLMREGSFHEMCRVILEHPPTLPSIQATHATDDAAAMRGLAPWGLPKALRGDLDSIVLKTLEKRRGDRYASAAALADDIRRYLGSESVEARNASPIHRLTRFVRRRRASVAVAAVALVALIGFMGFVITQNRRMAEQQIATKAQAEIAEKTRAFAFDMVSLLDEGRTLDEKWKLLSSSLEQLDPLFAEFPHEHLKFAQRLDNAWDHAHTDEFGRLLELALEHTLTAPPNVLPEMIAIRAVFAHSMTWNGHLNMAEALLGQVLTEQAAEHGPEALEVFETRLMIAINDKRAFRFAAAKDGTQAVLEDLRRVAGNDHRLTLLATGVLGAVHLDLGQPDAAERILRETLPRMESKLGPWHGTTQGANFNLAVVLAIKGNADQAFERLKYAMDHDFQYVEVDANGQRHYGPRGVRELKAFRSLRERPDFQQLVGEDGYLVALDAAHAANGERAGAATVAGWLRTALDRGCGPELVLHRLPEANLRGLVE